MRPLPIVLPFVLFSCATGDGTHPAVPRAPRPNLLADAGFMNKLPVTTATQGAWQLRTLAAQAGNGVHSGAGGTVPSPSGGRGAAGPSGPTTGGPTRPSTGSDDFYLGATRRTAGSEAPPLPALRAGHTDDNVDFEGWLKHLATCRGSPGAAGHFVDLDVAGRCTLRVVDKNGAAMPGVELRVVDEAGDKIVWRGTTYGDGRVPFYPAVAKADGGSGGPYLVEVPLGDRVVRHMWQGTNDTTVRMPIVRAAEPLALDVVFVIDTTGSMQDEIAAVQATLLSVTTKLRGLGREFDLRYGAVLYRDLGDQYVTAQHPLTTDIDAFDEALRGMQAGGGGDTPESLNQGLAVAIDGMAWRAGAAKVAFLIADAAPHLDYATDVPYDRSLRAAVAQGIRVHTVAASGLEPTGSLVFRQIAQFTRGEFVFVEYGGDTKASAEQHGVRAPVTGNNLDDILFTRIRDEIARWGA